MNTAYRAVLSIVFLLSFSSAVTAVSQKKPAGDNKQSSKASTAEEMRYYQRWLEEDVRYIIAPEEKSVFKKLTTTEEREKFIEDFWRRRDPTPESLQNEAKEEHYRRIAYANDHFASGKPGWLTDRGRIYIAFGPPDRKETNPTGTQLYRPEYEGGNMTTYPFEVWEYRYLEGIGTDVTIEFVDKSGTNNYEIALNDNEKDALFSITGSHVITSDQQQRFVRAKDMPFERLELYSKLNQPPPVKFKKLEEAVTARVTYRQLPVESQENFLRLTDESVLTAVAVEMENKDLSFEGVGDLYQASVNIYGRVTDITKRVVEVFEDVVNAHLTGAEVKQGSKGKSIYQKKMALRPGRYVLDAVAEDTLSGRMGTIQKLLIVPRLGEGGMTSSSLILATTLLPAVQAADLQSQFVLGDSKVIPNIQRRFNKGDPIGIYLQIYNLTLDQTRLRPAVDVSAGIKKGQEIVRKLGPSELSVNFSGQQITLMSVADTTALEPGNYNIEVTVTDKIAGKSLVRSQPFTIQ